jgi:hypothetical protein
MRYGLSIIGVIIFVVIAIVIIATTGGHKKAPITHGINVTQYNNSASSVNQITYGSLLSEGQRQGLEISISQSQVNVYVLNGYENTVAPVYSAANTPAAYGAFLAAMQTYGFVNSRKTTEQYPNAVCPLGNTYRYELTNGSKTVSSLWSSSCSMGDGNFAGEGSLIRQLFNLQVPTISTIVGNSGL